ncbi:hypothetical protein [Paraburkholderia caballeronis]|uniref:Carboxypeptidase regulatory-like domain-containing protein n=1 Tax=Paraburkholderia caballeronis TaxID=416943 RepID=A0A1H7GV87_9BURK|nr:hypothetical protein [Paraburkholderia caballeronis]PXW29757.1 hypothetical protein C7403_101615 [Paraburkholderia caballeronis]PXX05016.1 hypothetical protein C7407_101615 [Paraburkholderia caballeronis]RAK06077.1 hypothetical protein C7409_101615 [Paraburkholderia caballeronis]SEB48226.1 hypothetical protein SAMN05445871_0297 [Paraburkholderia caballeronis]SEK41988.1 hypothetical protein SAMN05192542_10221 [Paraburkholderia caballeronis]
MQKNKLNTGITKFALGASMCAALVACGGGNSSNSGTSSPSVTTNGTAAVGSAIVGGTVSLKCASGATASATTAADGTYSVTLKSADYPCVAQVSGGQANGAALASALHSVASAPGTTNVTPLTDLIVGVLGNGNAAALDGATSSTLSSTITAENLASALTKVQTAIATLPGKLTIASGFNPLNSQFGVGDANDALLDQYAAALNAAGLTQADAVTHTAGGQELTLAAFSTTAFTTPYTSFSAGWSNNLDGKTVLSIPDPLRGALSAEVSADATTGNLTLVGTTPFTGIVSLLGNRVGTLCVSGKGQASNAQHSLYIYVSPDFTQVTDLAEIKSALLNNSWETYEDCTKDSITYTTTATGLIVTYSDGSSDAVADADFSEAGNVEARQTASGVAIGTSVARSRLYKYTDPNSRKTTYATVETSSDKDSTDLAYDPTKDLNNVILSISQ